MAIDFDADLDEMFDSDDHGVVVTKFDASTFEGIFNNEFYAQDVGSVGFDSNEQALYAATSSVSGVSKGDKLTIESIDYIVASLEPDGTGMTRLVLHDGS